MIIIGYPGVGKSYAAEQIPNVIDLESSIFKHLDKENANEFTVYLNSNGTAAAHWNAKLYVDLAVSLSNQGKIVCVSSHQAVIDELLERRMKYEGEIAVCYPSLSMRDDWVDQLYSRAQGVQIGLDNDEEYQKNTRALKRAVDHYEEDIEHLSHLPFIKIVLGEDTVFEGDKVNHLSDWLKAKDRAAKQIEREK